MKHFERSPPGHPGSPDDTQLDRFELTYRVATCLYNAGFKTAGEVRNASDAELMHIYNFGKISLAETRREIGRSREAKPLIKADITSEFRKLSGQFAYLVMKMEKLLSFYEDE